MWFTLCFWFVGFGLRVCFEGLDIGFWLADLVCAVCFWRHFMTFVCNFVWYFVCFVVQFVGFAFWGLFVALIYVFVLWGLVCSFSFVGFGPGGFSL